LLAHRLERVEVAQRVLLVDLVDLGLVRFVLVGLDLAAEGICAGALALVGKRAAEIAAAVCGAASGVSGEPYEPGDRGTRHEQRSAQEHEAERDVGAGALEERRGGEVEDLSDETAVVVEVGGVKVTVPRRKLGPEPERSRCEAKR